MWYPYARHIYQLENLGPTVARCLTVDCVIHGTDVVYHLMMRNRSRTWWRYTGRSEFERDGGEGEIVGQSEFDILAGKTTNLGSDRDTRKGSPAWLGRVVSNEYFEGEIQAWSALPGFVSGIGKMVWDEDGRGRGSRGVANPVARCREPSRAVSRTQSRAERRYVGRTPPRSLPLRCQGDVITYQDLS